jgi:hypothetical protein
MTGKSFDEVMKKSVWGPLNLRQSSVFAPEDQSQIVTPPGDPMFNMSIGDAAPGGGMYMSISDASKHIHAVLNNKQLTPLQTRRWLKPTTHTADLRLSIGSPWEIQRIEGMSKWHNVDIYTKAGSIGSWTSQYGIIPDYDVGYNVFVATNGSVHAGIIEDIVQQNILPALYNVAREQANAKFGGIYSANGINSSMTLGVDSQHGLVIQNWISNGTDMFKVPGSGKPPLRALPTNLKAANRVAFRILPQRSGKGCMSWLGVDVKRYGIKALDSLVFHTGADGSATSVVLPAFRAKLTKRATASGQPMQRVYGEQSILTDQHPELKRWIDL